jgi:hypothetical protein
MLKAFPDYVPLIEFAQSQGTKLVTVSIGSRRIDWFDIEIQGNPRHGPRRDAHGAFRWSGPYCLQFACLNGAKRIFLAGCEGYESGKPWYFKESNREEFQKTRASKFHPGLTQRVVKPETQAVVDCWPDVEFVCLGPTSYEIDADNWRHVDLVE